MIRGHADNQQLFLTRAVRVFELCDLYEVGVTVGQQDFAIAHLLFHHGAHGDAQVLSSSR